MNTNGIAQQHWLFVTLHFALDTILLCASFLVAMQFRFGSEWTPALGTYWPGVLLGSLSFSCAAYVSNLYSRRQGRHTLLKRSTILGICYLSAVALMMSLFYLNFSTRIGRGVMLIGCGVSLIAILTHHAVLLRAWREFRERVALVVGSPEDEAEAKFLRGFGHDELDLIGVVPYNAYKPAGNLKVLGRMDELGAIAEREGLQRVLCTNRGINEPLLCRQFCQLRYSGVTVMPLIGVCEEIYQCVPVDLITPDWLLHASGLPHMLYIRKLKRGFDIVVSACGLLLLGPIAMVGMILVKLTSPGPIFFRQIRVGRFGRPFEIIKLRTMTVDAERDGAVWASKNDPRVTKVGAFLRKYRVDEIPQLVNVLRGEMSFVGPRPERPEFIEQLAAEIPCYLERLMVQPGITGWAQVNYPYGASIDDARHKLEYDLYYTKHMSLFLDIFSLLDTVRIIVRGGTRESQAEPWRSARDVSSIPVAPKASPSSAVASAEAA